MHISEAASKCQNISGPNDHMCRSGLTLWFTHVRRTQKAQAAFADQLCVAWHCLCSQICDSGISDLKQVSKITFGSACRLRGFSG